MFGDGNWFESIEKYKDELKDVVNKLRLDPCMDVPKMGDTVIVAAGPLGMGHSWIRLEAEVLHVANNSYKIRFHNKSKFLYPPNGYYDVWIDPVLVLDIISKDEAEQAGGTT